MLFHFVQHLYDPLDPDKDTIPTRKPFKAEVLEQEFFLLHHLARMLTKGNFHRLPQSEVHQALKEHQIGEGVCVSVNPNNYDTLQVRCFLKWFFFLKRNCALLVPSDLLFTRFVFFLLKISIWSSCKMNWMILKNDFSCMQFDICTDLQFDLMYVQVNSSNHVQLLMLIHRARLLQIVCKPVSGWSDLPVCKLCIAGIDEPESCSFARGVLS